MLSFKQFIAEGPLAHMPAEKGLKRNFFHGNYGGFGNRGGKPVDDLDHHFQKHDVGYHYSKKPSDRRKHDVALVKATGNIMKSKNHPLSTRIKAGMAHAYFRTKTALS